MSGQLSEQHVKPLKLHLFLVKGSGEEVWRATARRKEDWGSGLYVSFSK